MGFDLEALIEAVGYVGLFLIIYAETGLLIGFFLPGDTLLITAGLLASRGELSVVILIPLLIVAAITGDFTGYQIGARAGPYLYRREDSRFFKRSHLQKAHDFYLKHGGKTIFLARWLAIVRTFAPTVAGAAEMPYRRFMWFNIVGGMSWVSSMVLLGYFVGEAVPHPDLAIIAVVGIILAVSVAPAAWGVWKERRAVAGGG